MAKEDETPGANPAEIENLIEQIRGTNLEPGAKQKGRATNTTGIVVKAGGRKIALYLSGRRHAGENLAELLAKREKGLAPRRPTPSLTNKSVAPRVSHTATDSIIRIPQSKSVWSMSSSSGEKYRSWSASPSRTRK